MSNFAIFTDTGADLALDLLAKWDVHCACLTFKFTDEDTVYLNNELPPKEFYQAMREGRQAKTSAVNSETFRMMFEEELQKGRDVLYLGLSSGISNTYNAGRIAAEQLREEYPDRKILAVDPLSASAGLGMWVAMAVEMRDSGKTIEETAKYIEDNRLSMCHWFTVDDLVYLKRGGRINPAVAFVGGMLGIKPVMHVDNEGHLANVNKVRGRRAAIRAMAERYAALALDKKEGMIYISQADCMADAEALVADIQALTGRTKGADHITDVGTVIGSHSGPGTLALFFLGSER
jgi:DegV family protein with EDD domain